MIQQDEESDPIELPTLDSFGSSELSNSTHSSLLCSRDLSAGQWSIIYLNSTFNVGCKRRAAI